MPCKAPPFYPKNLLQSCEIFQNKQDFAEDMQNVADYSKSLDGKKPPCYNASIRYTNVCRYEAKHRRRAAEELPQNADGTS